jgi:diguanylate cyclase (GGDEF)-like protein
MVDDEAVLLRGAIQTASQELLRMQTLHNVWHRGDLSECHLEITVTNMLEDASVAGLVLNSRDVTDRTVLEEELLHQAFHDSLTTLSNRAMFKNRLEHALTRRDRKQGSLAVLFLDLDGFKEINDTLGHSSGDQLLVQVAQRLRMQSRPSDTVARFGGDEFAVLVEDLVDPAYAIDLAQRMNAILRAPYELGPTRVHITASVGIAYHGDHATDSEQLLRNADLAMYQAKSARTGGYAVYDPRMHAGLVQRIRLEADLRAALVQDALDAHYQPLINMRTGCVTGVEALARWQHPVLGSLSPVDFIPLAESTGLIRPLGEWILRQACWQTVQWQRRSPRLRHLGISVNVSARQLYDGDLTLTVRQALRTSGLPPECLTLEMTESVLLDDSGETLSTLRAIRAMGVRLAIDDFGTGYSSLSYLHRFPVDVLKIDRSFVERLAQDGDASLVSTIVGLGRAMNLETVAEGIERLDEMLILRRQGCATGQGYHFCPPLAADELYPLLVDGTWIRGIGEASASLA